MDKLKGFWVKSEILMVGCDSNGVPRCPLHSQRGDGLLVTSKGQDLFDYLLAEGLTEMRETSYCAFALKGNSGRCPFFESAVITWEDDEKEIARHNDPNEFMVGPKNHLMATVTCNWDKYTVEERFKMIEEFNGEGFLYSIVEIDQ